MPPLSDSEIEQRLTESPTGPRRGSSRSPASCTFADFSAAIAFVNRVAELAEAANHHPDILVHGWNKVRLELSTHSEGGLTDNDFKLAGEIDRLPEPRAALGRPTIALATVGRSQLDERRRRTSPK